MCGSNNNSYVVLYPLCYIRRPRTGVIELSDSPWSDCILGHSDARVTGFGLQLGLGLRLGLACILGSDSNMMGVIPVIGELSYPGSYRIRGVTVSSNTCSVAMEFVAPQ